MHTIALNMGVDDAIKKIQSTCDELVSSIKENEKFKSFYTAVEKTNDKINEELAVLIEKGNQTAHELNGRRASKSSSSASNGAGK